MENKDIKEVDGRSDGVIHLVFITSLTARVKMKLIDVLSEEAGACLQTIRA